MINQIEIKPDFDKSIKKMHALFIARFFSVALFFLFLNHSGFAQKIYLKTQFIGNSESTANAILKKQNLKTVYNDSGEVVRTLRSLLNTFYENGFLTATIDSISKNDSVLTAIINYGPAFKWAELKTRIEDDFIVDEAGVRLKLLQKKPFSPSQVAGISAEILKFCENNGYPFASVFLKDVKLNGEKISATLAVEKNQLIKIDSIETVGTSKLSTVYLFNFISIKPGDIYNESLIRKISTRLRELPFVLQTKSPLVRFSQKGCQLILFTDQKKSNQIDGVIGVLPANDKDEKTQITGEVRMRLHSAFNRGELIDLNWKQPGTKTQDLKIKFSYPFLFKSPFGIDAGLNVYKKDTSYFDVNLMFGLNFYLPGGDFLKVFVNRQSSSLLSTDGYENITTLPPYADVSKTLFGLAIRKEDLDYRFNPRKGYSIDFTGSVGKKVIEKNPNINEVVYDSVQLTSTNYQAEIIINYYVPLAQRHVLSFNASAAYMKSENIFTNELFRLGGLRSLRGFDEESIYTSQFVTGKIEYRFLLDVNSFLFLFYNQGYYENHAVSPVIHDKPLGFGTGITFETRLGIFAFSYALGKEFSNPVYFRSGKIHFGVVNYF